MVIELGHEKAEAAGTTARMLSGPWTMGHGPFEMNSSISVRAMVCESVGPVAHEVSVPFHDSQVRGAALLIQTGWDQRWGTDAYWEPGPFLGEHFIFRMVRSGVRVVGVDFPVIERSLQTRLITAGKIPIVENLHGLASLPRVGFRFTVLPLDTALEQMCAVSAFGEIISPPVP